MFNVESNRILLKDDDNIIGYVFYKIENNLVSIMQVYVDSKYRNMGYANKLMDYTYNYFNKNNYDIEMVCSYAKKWLEKRS